jgi:lipoate---protein ligase
MPDTGSALGPRRPGAGWEVTTWSGPVAELHGRDLPGDGRRHVWLFAPERPALVLGSTQSEAVADAGALAAGGIDLVRRRSGGGAVLVVPGRSLWVDVVVPRGDPLWDDDVTASFAWFGRVWRAALAGLGVAADVHTGPVVRRDWGRLVCFAGLGAGEVVVGERKVVGLSQRRTREVARYQAVVEVGAADPSLALATADLLTEPAGPAEREALIAVLRRSTGQVAVDRGELVAALLAALPDG